MLRRCAMVLAALSLGAGCAGRYEPPVQVGVSGVLEVRNQFVEIYGVKTEAGVILFDAGFDKEGAGIDALLARLHASPEEVKAIFITHGHGDHIAAAKRFPNATLYAGKDDVALMSGARKNPKRIGRLMKSETIEGVTPLDGRASFPFGAEEVVAIPLPGHTAGSYAYAFRGILFVGDSIQYKRGKLRPAVKAFSEDAAQNKKTLTEIETSLAGLSIRQVCTGHQGCTPTQGADALLQALATAAKE